VEYVLPGIGQTQVNARVDMTFARGLRAILRQDPDVVMVGEIRDRETAEIAVQASLTGHLVLSTLHTNTAIGAIMRLQDMGVEPFLLASSVQVIIAQRLVRRLCESCRQPVEVDSTVQQMTGLPEGAMVYQAEGCDACRQSGYKGRVGIYEVLVINDEIRRMIHQGADEQQMLNALRAEHDSIEDHGRQRILSGETSIDEVMRVSALQGEGHGRV
jgi:general secretion pathway protein E